MTFMVDGRQVVAIASGRDLLAFALVGAASDTSATLSSASARH
jgi:hypothetical protein